MQANSTRKPKRKTLPKPFVHKYDGNWLCEYFKFNEEGQRRPCRKAFVKDLKRQGIEPTLEAQRKAAIEFRDGMLKGKREEERLKRREREQTILTLAEMKEIKASIGVFREIPFRKKSLLDAFILYREQLKLSVDSPLLKDAVAIFLGRKKAAANGEDGEQRLSEDTYRTLKQRLNHLLTYFKRKGLTSLKIGDVTSKQLIEYFEGLKVADRTRLNYVTDVGGFFYDAADPKDKDRLINENPMDGVHVYFRKFNKGKVAKHSRTRKPKAPIVLQLERSKHALRLAVEMQDQGMLGFTVAGLYLGMRPSEVYDMVAVTDFWNKYIKLEEGLVRIDGFGKMRDQRTIIMSENCKEWLRYIKERELPLCFKRKRNGQNLQYANFRAKAFLPNFDDAERLIELRRLHKTGKKPSAEDKAFMRDCAKALQQHEDVFRHTYGTNFYYANGCDKNRTIEQMGHSGEVFVAHYRGLLDSPSDSKEFYEQYPNDYVENWYA